MAKIEKSAVLKTAIHAVEIAVAGGIALFVVYMFRDDASVQAALKDALLNIIPVVVGAGLAKFGRASATSPIRDYVNE